MALSPETQSGIDPQAQAIIDQLGLIPHPEGGYYRETFRDPAYVDGRSCSTAIFYLLAAGQRSHWHRVDAAEIWHWYGGAPLDVWMAGEGQKAQRYTLGNDIAHGQLPQHVVPAHVWQSAQSCGAWTLVGCTVAPAFEFSRFEIAPPGWEPKESKG